MKDLIIVGSLADNSFAEDIAHQFNQQEDYSDLISLKSFINKEFCPRFIANEEGMNNVGYKLKNKRIVIVSTASGRYTRNDLAMRSFLIARAAKDNGAQHVILLEPDLFYSAQDRGPRAEQGVTRYKRDNSDFKKFDGQPFSARLFADLLRKSGVDEVVTIHNHSHSVKNIFMDRFGGHFYNLQPADLFADYMNYSDIVNAQNLVLCAPDKGAIPFVKEVQSELGNPSTQIVLMDKARKGERNVIIKQAQDSPADLKSIEGKDVAVIDDMVRTGNTIVECCRILKKANPRRVVFFVTHFYSSLEGRIKMNHPAIDEIVTTNTIPQILNRDMQGRLRKKMVVLKIGRWISRYVLEILGAESEPDISRHEPLYTEDMSSKNPRWKGKLGPLFSSI